MKVTEGYDDGANPAVRPHLIKDKDVQNFRGAW